MKLENKIALVLNPKSGGPSSWWRKRGFRKLGERMDNVTVYSPRCLEESQDMAQEIVEDKVGLVALGGGDGTIYYAWNSIQSALEKKGKSQPHPQYKFLKLGTGNALSNFIGATKHVRDLHEIVTIIDEKGSKSLVTKPLALIEVTATHQSGEKETTYFPFAGVGLDAMVLEDYNTIKDSTDGLIRHVPGYVLATARTIWHVMWGGRINTSLITDGPAYKVEHVDQEGNIDYNKIDEGVFSDEVNVAGVSRVPEYGARFRAFPYAEIAGGRWMNLRVITGDPFSTALKLAINSPKMYFGTHRAPYIHDLFVQQARFESTDTEKGTPAQTAGESLGNVKALDCKMSPYEMQVVLPHQEIKR